MGRRGGKVVWLGFGIAVGVSVWALAAEAEVALDGTLGRAGGLEGPAFEIRAEDGRRAGRNLFHSFSRFGLDKGERATFSGPGAVRNVIGRVTGGEASRIDGTLASTIPGADLWLLNPSGILFGPDARLEVQGSFHASTADELRFGDGAVFSALDPEGSVLSVAEPRAFGFLGREPGRIEVDQGVLEVPAREALSLVGGSVTVSAGNNGSAGGGSAGTIRAEAGRVTLAGVRGAGAVQVSTGATSGSGAEVRLTDQAFVDASGEGGGTVRIRGGAFVVENQSRVFADNTGAADAAPGRGINVGTASVRVEADAWVKADALGAGDAGTVTVQTGDLRVARGGQLRSVTFSAGDAAPVIVEANRVLVTQDGSSSFTAITGQVVGSQASGNAGSVTIDAKEIEVRAGGQIDSATFGLGRAGTVDIINSEHLIVSADGSPTFTGISTQAIDTSAPAGTIRIRAQDIEVRGNAQNFNDPTVAAITADGGGSVIVEARNLRVLDHSRVSTLNDEPRQGGGIDIKATGTIEIANRGFISTATSGDGDAGDVVVRAPRLNVDNGLIGANTGLSNINKGNAGTVRVEAGILTFLNEGRIFTGTDSFGKGGDIFVRANTIVADATLDLSEFHTDNHTGISAAANPRSRGAGGRVVVDANTSILLRDGGEISSDAEGGGDAGPVEVSAPVIELEDGGNIASFNTGGGNAGSIKVTVGQRLEMDRGAFITTTSRERGGGRIDIGGGDLLKLSDEAEITSTVAGGGDTTAGNITTDSRFLVLDDSRVLSQANEGAGGSIDIEADTILTSTDSLIDASSRFGVDGTVATSNPEADLAGGLAVPPSVFLNASDLLRESCAAWRSGSVSSFTATGRGGLPPDPAGPLPGSYLDQAEAAGSREAVTSVAFGFTQGCRTGSSS